LAERNVGLCFRFELAQYAIVTKGNVKKAMSRLKKLRKIEAEYGTETMDLATASAEVERACPGSFYAAGRDSLGRPMFVMRYADFNPKGFETPHHWNCLVRCKLAYSLDALATTVKVLLSSPPC
jgi:hypothetical protein